MEVLVQDIVETLEAESIACTAYGPCMSTYLQLQAEFSLDDMEVIMFNHNRPEISDSAKLVLTKEKIDTGICQIVVEETEYAYALIMGVIKVNRLQAYIHPTAEIHEEATIGEGVRIGAYCVIGKSVIGDRTKIKSQVKIHDDVRIGANCIIQSQVIIGAGMKKFFRDADNRPISIPDIGAVEIGSQVEIGSHTSIGKGNCSVTKIADFVKIGTAVIIEPGATIGESVIIDNQVIIPQGATIDAQESVTR